MKIIRETIFLTKKQVLVLYEHLITKYGGSYGIRDENLLDSSLEAPKSGYGGEYFHKSIFDKAAAYLFHLVKNHPFIDGNKRIALACADIFLSINGYILEKKNEKEIYEFVLKLASDNSISKEEISIFLKKNSKIK